MDPNKSLMYSSLPRPPTSRLPAKPSTFTHPGALAEASQSDINIKKSMDPTGLKKPMAVTRSGITPQSLNALKRPAAPTEHADQRHTQTSKSVAPLKQTSSTKNAATKMASLPSTISGISADDTSNTKDDEARPPTSFAQPKKRAPRKDWDVKGRLQDLEEDYVMMRQLHSAAAERDDQSSMRVIELETLRAQLETQITGLKGQLENFQLESQKFKRLYEEEDRSRRAERDDAQRQLRNETDDLRRRAQNELEDMQRRQRQEMTALEDRATQQAERTQKKIEDMQKEMMEAAQRNTFEIQQIKADASGHVLEIQSKAARDTSELRSKFETEKHRLETDLENKSKALDGVQTELMSAQKMNQDLRDKICLESTNSLTLESSARALRENILHLEKTIVERDSHIQRQNKMIQELEDKLQDSEHKLRAEETTRRKLHNEILELKGNIRVFCRVRPTLKVEAEPATIEFPDSDGEAKEIALQGAQEKSLMGSDITKKHAFTYDKVFGPECNNPKIFEEISQLVQSALDGYNVCIFCYGQTGSGKTYTMTSQDGMIPQAVKQIYDTATKLEDKGWKYLMEGSFVEVYNENLNDLLGKATDLDKKKLEIRHDKGKTSITDCTTLTLDKPEMMEEILNRASANRSVAATKANERSSRSHSVFILKLTGINSITGERSEGTLNLVDLAGSERLSHSQSTGDRLKETQNINKSLSSLGDVIAALASGKDGAHVPYRNSKLTYLLQNSLGGNSKTLMFVMVSPLQAHIQETITSLKFATKVINTHIGTAKKIKVEPKET